MKNLYLKFRVHLLVEILEDGFFMLIKHCIKIFKDNKKLKNISDTTMTRYNYYFKDFMKYCLDKEVVNIEGVNTNFIREYLIYRMEDLENGVSTTNTHIRTLKAFLNLLIKEEIITKNPMDRIEYMKEDIKIETFTTADIQK